MDHVVEGEIFGAEGLRQVLFQIQMCGHSFMKPMSSISMPSIHGRVSEAYLVAVHLHIKSEMRDLLKLATYPYLHPITDVQVFRCSR